jgi:hypothetical protein
MAITAKVKVQSKNEFLSNSTSDSKETGVQLSFTVNYANGANKEWAKYTPSLTLQMTVKPEVAEKFAIGDNYTLTFTPDED